MVSRVVFAATLLTARNQWPKHQSRSPGQEHALDFLRAVRSTVSRSRAGGIFDEPCGKSVSEVFKGETGFFIQAYQIHPFLLRLVIRL